MKPQALLTNIRSVIVLITIALLFTGCRKQKATLPLGASLSIINAIADANYLYVSLAGTIPIQYYLYSKQLPYNTYNTYNGANRLTCPAGEQELAFYRASDTSNPEKPLIALNLPLGSNHIYTLFLTGTSAAPDTVFTEDLMPSYGISDSVTGLRFINLSPGSNPITVNIAGMDNESEISDLPYKSYTVFKRYPAHSKINDYTFEFRDKATGNLLATYNTGKMNSYESTARATTVNKWLFRNSTIVFIGLPDGQGVKAQTAAVLNHF